MADRRIGVIMHGVRPSPVLLNHRFRAGDSVEKAIRPRGRPYAPGCD